MSDDPVSLMGGAGALSIPTRELLYNENEFGVVQSPHQGSYMVHHNRNNLMEPWEQSNIKPIEIISTVHNLLPPPQIPDVIVDEPPPPPAKEEPKVQYVSPRSLPKVMQLDAYNEELFQLDDDDDDDDLVSKPLALSSMKRHRKMSQSTQLLNLCPEEGDPEEETVSYKQLQRFRSDSNLYSGESNMSLVERVTMLQLTASKKNFKSSPTPPRLLTEHSEEHHIEESGLKTWLTKRAVNISAREMNAMTPFSS